MKKTYQNANEAYEGVLNNIIIEGIDLSLIHI